MGLSATDLTVSFGARVVLDAVSIDVAPGRVTVVLGANGAGKSTLLRALAGLIPARCIVLGVTAKVLAAVTGDERAHHHCSWSWRP